MMLQQRKGSFKIVITCGKTSKLNRAADAVLRARENNKEKSFECSPNMNE